MQLSTPVSSSHTNPAPKFGTLLKITSPNPNWAIMYGQELLQKLIPKDPDTIKIQGQAHSTPDVASTHIATLGGGKLILPGSSSDSMSAALGGPILSDLDPSKPHGFPDPRNRNHYIVVADTPGTTPHSTLYTALVNTLNAMALQFNMSPAAKESALHVIQQNFTGKPDLQVDL